MQRSALRLSPEQAEGRERSGRISHLAGSRSIALIAQLDRQRRPRWPPPSVREDRREKRPRLRAPSPTQDALCAVDLTCKSAITMSAPLRPSLLPQCTSCARRFTNSGLGAWPRFQQQVRGAKKKASNLPQTLPVRLLKDVKAYGRKGTSGKLPIAQLQLTGFRQARSSPSRLV